MGRRDQTRSLMTDLVTYLPEKDRHRDAYTGLRRLCDRTIKLCGPNLVREALENAVLAWLEQEQLDA